MTPCFPLCKEHSEPVVVKFVLHEQAVPVLGVEVDKCFQLHAVT